MRPANVSARTLDRGRDTDIRSSAFNASGLRFEKKRIRDSSSAASGTSLERAETSAPATSSLRHCAKAPSKIASPRTSGKARARVYQPTAFAKSPLP